MVDLMKFPGKTPAYYYARAAIALKRGEKEAAQKYFENVKKYYSEEKCRYFAQSLKEMDLTLTAPTQPEKTPDSHSASGSAGPLVWVAHSSRIGQDDALKADSKNANQRTTSMDYPTAARGLSERTLRAGFRDAVPVVGRHDSFRSVHG